VSRFGDVCREARRPQIERSDKAARCILAGVDRLEPQTEWRPCQGKRLDRNRKFGKVRQCRDSWNNVVRLLAVLFEVASIGKVFGEEFGFMRFDVFAPFARSTCGWLENRDWRSPYCCASRHQSNRHSRAS
jgi:hypothetical protein